MEGYRLLLNNFLSRGLVWGRHACQVLIREICLAGTLRSSMMQCNPISDSDIVNGDLVRHSLLLVVNNVEGQLRTIQHGEAYNNAVNSW